MGARNGYGRFIPAGYHSQEPGTLQNRDALVDGCFELRIVELDGCRIDHQLGSLDIFRLVPHKDWNAQAADAGQVIALVDI